MTREAFNRKYASRIGSGFYGMAIEDEEICDYLDKEFTKEIKLNRAFLFYQIKLKFGYARVYSDSEKDREWENYINTVILKK